MSDFQVILMVGTPATGEIQSLLEHFRQDNMVTLLHSERLGSQGNAIQPLLNSAWPDLICLFADTLTEQGEDVLAFCDEIRNQGLHYRPVIVVQSAGAEEKRIEYLIRGADDILGTDISQEELRVRLLVHLRRNVDVLLNEVTQLPGLSFTSKVVQRRLNQQKPLALLLIELDQLDVYSDIYGEVPTHHVLKTLSALLSRLVLIPDFISQTDENHFVIVTHPDRAEKVAALLCRQFETTAPNFYSEQDRKQGYMTSVIADNISQRVPLMSLSIGIASTETQPIERFTSLFNTAQQMNTLAQMKPGCSWLSDRFRLAGAQSQPVLEQKPGILVLEPDAALAYLLKTTLNMEGYAVEVVNTLEDARQILIDKATVQPFQLIILDALINEQEHGLQLTREVRQEQPAVRIICTSSLHQRHRVLEAGADLYLPKPFELSILFSWIHRLLREGR